MTITAVLEVLVHSGHGVGHCQRQRVEARTAGIDCDWIVGRSGAATREGAVAGDHPTVGEIGARRSAVTVAGGISSHCVRPRDRAVRQWIDRQDHIIGVRGVAHAGSPSAGSLTVPTPVTLTLVVTLVGLRMLTPACVMVPVELTKLHCGVPLVAVSIESELRGAARILALGLIRASIRGGRQRRDIDVEAGQREGAVPIGGFQRDQMIAGRRVTTRRDIGSDDAVEVDEIGNGDASRRSTIEHDRQVTGRESSHQPRSRE